MVYFSDLKAILKKEEEEEEEDIIVWYETNVKNENC